MSERQGIWVVDRIEGDTVVLVEDGTGRSLDVSLSLISVSIDEGMVLRVPAAEGEASIGKRRCRTKNFGDVGC